MAPLKKHKTHWLITAFENQSNLVLEEIKKLESESDELPFVFHYSVLPFEYDASFDTLQFEVSRLKKSGVKLTGILSLGEGSEEFKIETQANNLDDVAEYADNAGIKRSGQKIFQEFEADATFLFRFPIEAFGRIRSSKSPGYFVNNHLCAKATRAFSTEKDPYFGFIHVPKAGQGGMFTASVCGAMIFNGFRKVH